MPITLADSMFYLFVSMKYCFGRILKFPIHILDYHIKISLFTLLTKSNKFSCYLLTCKLLISYMCSAQNNTRRMTNEEERLAKLRRTLHCLATRVPKIILKRVDSTFPVLKDKVVSAMRSIMELCRKVIS
jgi:hypothetical protein